LNCDGKHALLAYESVGGVRFIDEATATQEIDLLMDPAFDLQARAAAQLVEETLSQLHATQASSSAAHRTLNI
jgi:hypothetical protein